MTLLAAKEYTDGLDQLSPEEKRQLKATFPDLASDTSRTPLAAGRFTNIVSKVGPAAGDVLTKIIVNVVTDAAKKYIGF